MKDNRTLEEMLSDLTLLREVKRWARAYEEA